MDIQVTRMLNIYLKSFRGFENTRHPLPCIFAAFRTGPMELHLQPELACDVSHFWLLVSFPEAGRWTGLLPARDHARFYTCNIPATVPLN
jgi:hypothetical protein